jgi:hypothetical protein
VLEREKIGATKLLIPQVGIAQTAEQLGLEK